ncbi:MAG: phosphoethanolamine transferase [Beijerinckiaceae bacterium]
MTRLPGIGPGALSAAVSLFIVLALNGTLWSQFYGVVEPRGLADWLFLSSFALFQVAAYYFFLRLLSLPFLLKVVSALLIVVAAAASHFMGEYGAVIDVNMIRNVLQTDSAEARDLTTFALVMRVFVLGVVPAALILFARIDWPAWKPLLRSNLKGGLTALAVVGVNFAVFSGAYFSVMREHKDVVFKSTPANVVMAASKLGLRSLRHYSGPVAPIGIDARLEPAPAPDGRPLVTLLVIGETARAENFSLFGYARDTNRELKKIPDLIPFPHVSSCGTDTAVSVPCIFSGLGRSRYSLAAFQRRENLLDLVRRTGLDVLWIENQGGCKGVCARIPTVTLTDSKDARFCGDGECHDEILLEGLEQRIAAMQNGGVIVLHMMGSHGPAYFKRVPGAFARFQPVCETSQFSKCTSEQIVNSYDNTIAYTDFVLSRLVALLRKQDGVDTMMLYVADHGESLGENGVYLHAMPYFMAPVQQTHVPMLMWFSQGVFGSLAIDNGCIADLAHEGHFSHDNVFHTVLGMQRVQTSVYNPDLDILQPCRRRKTL